MAETRDPQSFALLLAEADGGLLNRQISAAFADLNDDLDARSFLHDAAFKGEMTIKLKLTNDHGKIDVKADCIVKKPPTKYTGARFFRTQEGELTTQDPRAVRDMFADRRADVKAKGAAPPKAAAGKEA
jgi:hypothetical protein